MTIHDKQLQSLRAFCSSFCGRTAACRVSVVPGQILVLGSSAVPQGKIKKIISDKGFGFIAADQGDLFFHHSEVKAGTFDQLQEGDLVEFTVGQGKKGPCATDVKRVK
jgi:CspA family cold shock protein